jgi:hypothetical protein
LGCYENSKDTLEARRDLKNVHRNETPPIEVDEEYILKRLRRKNKIT